MKVLKENFFYIICAIFLIWIIWFDMNQVAPRDLMGRVGQTVGLSGVISDKPIEKDSGAEIVVDNVLLFARGGVTYQYGDNIRFTGKLEEPKNFLTDQEKDFDYVNYLRKDGIFFVMRNPKIELISAGGGSAIKRALFSFRDKLASALKAAIPSPESEVMRGLILGERAMLDSSLKQLFEKTGTIHIVTIAGYHINLVVEWVTAVISFLPLWLSFISGVTTIFFYIIMTGGAETAIRAGIMAVIALIARATGRIYDSLRALVVAAVLMVAMNPLILLYDTSFQLSFLATLGAIFITPRVQKYFLWIKWRRLQETLAMTTAIYIFVLPFIIYKIGSFSLVALPANFAIMPLIPTTMVLGFATSFVGLASPHIAAIFGKVAYILLHYELTAITFFAGLSWSSLIIPHFPLIAVILIYVTFFYAARLRIPVLITLIIAGFLSAEHYQLNQTRAKNIQTLLAPVASLQLDPRTETSNCRVNGPLPDHTCTPGAVFADVTVEKICVKGYTKSVRSVSEKLRRQVFAEYGIAYPVPQGVYENDHLIPLALGGSNDIANLFPEATLPTPGFHEKDLVEIYLQEEVCGHRAGLGAAAGQIATNWIAIYENLSPATISRLRAKYGGK